MATQTISLHSSSFQESHYYKQAFPSAATAANFNSFSFPNTSSREPKTRSLNPSRKSIGMPTMGFKFKDKDPSRSRKVSEVHSTPSFSSSKSSLPEPPTSHGRFIAATFKKAKRQKSFTSLLRQVPDPKGYYSSPLATHRVGGTSGNESDESFFDVAVDSPSDDEDQPEGFTVKDRFLKRGNTTLHPYQDEAPYMQSYDPVCFQSDQMTDYLLRRINPNGSSTFHDYGSSPPSKVLDLGCGEGHWATQAAAEWRWHGTQITGLDLVDVVAEGGSSFVKNNFTLVRGNFVKYSLPFPDNTFDLVRMANLTLCIPYDRWEFVLTEVHRVLTLNGRLELVDDQIFFPYDNSPSVSPAVHRTPSRHNLSLSESATSAFDDDDDHVRQTRAGRGSARTHVNHREKSSHRAKPAAPHNPFSNVRDWAALSASSKNLETVFERMLEQKYRIHTRPHEFIRNILHHVFGRGNAAKISSNHLSLAPRSGHSHYQRRQDGWSESDRESDKASVASSDSGYASGKKSWLTIEWDKKEKERERCLSNRERKADFSPSIPAATVDAFPFPPMHVTHIPDALTPKAAGRLGIVQIPDAVSAKAAVRLGIAAQTSAEGHSHNATGRSAQTPGLVLWPSTFIPIPPAELEMHACKHVHALLGCKYALAEFVQGFRDENGAATVSDQELEDMFWEYECFRRQRFHWPSDPPDLNIDLDTPMTEFGHSVGTTSIPGSTRPRMTPRGSSEAPHQHQHQPYQQQYQPIVTLPYRRDELTHVRSIRVYEAFKV